MRYIISEKQLASLIVKQKEMGEQMVASTEPSISTAGSSTSSSSDDKGSSPGADDSPPYPEVPNWGDHGQLPKKSAGGFKNWGEDGQKPVVGSANSTF